MTAVLSKLDSVITELKEHKEMFTVLEEKLDALTSKVDETRKPKLENHNQK